MASLVNLGHVEVVFDTAVRPPSTGAAASPITSRDVSLTAVQRAVTVPLLQPAWLPTPTMALAKVQQLAIAPDATITTLLYRESSTSWVAIHEQPLASIRKRGLPVAFRQGTIAGKIAALYTRTLPLQNQSAGQVTLLSGLVELHDLLVEITGPSLTATDMDRIGASLH